jgi:hypothetical protein
MHASSKVWSYLRMKPLLLWTEIVVNKNITFHALQIYNGFTVFLLSSSNLGPEICYPVRSIPQFPFRFKGKNWNNVWLCHDRLLPHSSEFMTCYCIFLSFDIIGRSSTGCKSCSIIKHATVWHPCGKNDTRSSLNGRSGHWPLVKNTLYQLRKLFNLEND